MASIFLRQASSNTETTFLDSEMSLADYSRDVQILHPATAKISALKEGFVIAINCCPTDIGNICQ
jgi:hypothetical protein